MQYPQDPNDCFGLLRSLLQASSDLAQLRGLLKHTQTLAPEVYREQWLPYLHDVWPNRRRRPLARCLTLEALTDWVALAPFAHFLFEPQCGPSELKLWLKSPWMAHVSSLDLGRCRLWSGCFETLFEHTTFEPLHTLVMGGQRLKEHNFDILWHHPICRNLNTLDLSHNEIGSHTISQIIDAPLSHALTHLHLRGCGVWTDNEYEEEIFSSTISRDVIALLRSASHLNLKTLNVSDNTPDDSPPLDVSPLLASPHMAQLEVLDLGATTPSDETIDLLSTHPNVRNLRRLDLSSTWLEEPQIIALAQSPHLTNVTQLTLEGCAFAAPGCAALAKSTLLKGIQELVLSCCEIGPEGAIALFEDASFEHLEKLYLDHGEIGPLGAKSMVAADFSALKELVLWGCAIGDDGLEYLIQNKTLAPKRLELDHNHITARGLKAMLQAPTLRRIEHLSLRRNPIGPLGVEMLIQWTPPQTLKSLALYDNGITRAEVDLLQATPLWAKITSLQNEF